MTVQRMSDVILALVLLLVCLPTLLLTCLILTSEHARAPIRRTDHRMANGRRVRLYRLQISQKTPSGRRLTKSGALAQRLHIHRVPMLINVLAGDLTLVGPEHDGLASPRMLAERHLV